MPGEDEFTLGMIEMLNTRKIPIWLVSGNYFTFSILDDFSNYFEWIIKC